MGFIIILFSEAKNQFYIGYTSNLEDRITQQSQKKELYK